MKKVEAFLNQLLPIKKPLLLGFSGGGDSLALAHFLIQKKVPLHLAHFDHGWREESLREAMELKSWAEKQNIPISIERWDNPLPSEDEARRARYSFFEHLFEADQFEALVLAHHSDDQAETILKRLLEGAHLHHLKAMEPIAYRQKMPIWRPLLMTSKKEIRSYLKEYQLEAIEDPTNQDLKYLRARMRGKILPYLSETFGKNVADPLARLGEKGSLLEDYLKKQTEKFKPIQTELGLRYDFSNAHPFEVEYILSQAPFQTPSYHLFKKIHHALKNRLKNATISKKILVHEEQLLYLKEEYDKLKKLKVKNLMTF